MLLDYLLVVATQCCGIIVVIHVRGLFPFHNSDYTSATHPRHVSLPLCSGIAVHRAKANPELGLLPHTVHPEVSMKVNHRLVGMHLHVKNPQHLCNERSHLPPCQFRPNASSQPLAEWKEAGGGIVLEGSVPRRMGGGQPSLRSICAGLVETTR